LRGGLEVLRRLLDRKTQIHVFPCPFTSIIGSELYLAGLNQSERSRILEVSFWKCLDPPHLLRFRNPALLGQRAACLKASLDQLGLSYRTGPFESIYCQRRVRLGELRYSDAFLFKVPYLNIIPAGTVWRIIEETSLNEAC